MPLTDKIRFTNEDCMNLMARTQDKFYDLAIVDPQTGQGEGEKHLTRGKEVIQANGTRLRIATVHAAKQWDKEPPAQKYYDELFRVSKHQIIMCENYLQFAQKSSSPGRIVWNLLRNNDFSDCQIMWTSLTNKIEYFEYMWNGMIQGKGINSRRQIGNKKLNQRRIHPSEKPIKVYYNLLKNYAKPGDKILDTHGGSLSIGIACHYMGFELDACELDPDYYAAACKRFREQTLQLKAEL